MLEQIDFNIGNLEIEAPQLTKNTVIICETEELAEVWRNALRNIKKDTNDVMYGFSGFDIDDEPYKTNEEFEELLSKLLILEVDEGILIKFPDEEIQTFFISTDISIVYKCDTYFDVWFCKTDNFYSLAAFKKTKEFYTKNNNNKDIMYKEIRRGVYGF